MQKYTSGELAKLVGVSVRTVQYYDSRNVLVPSEISEGGRRLYNENDLKRLKIICFLRNAGISINNIEKLFKEQNSEEVFSTLLNEQKKILQEEVANKQKQLELIDNVNRQIKSVDNFSVDNIGDVAHVVKQKRELKRLRLLIVLTGLPVNIFEWVSIILWITRGLWWLFAIYLGVAIVFSVFISLFYFKHVEYICPHCHTIFKPKLKHALFANHTPTLRKLTCPNCNEKSFCIETYVSNKEN